MKILLALLLSGCASSCHPALGLDWPEGIDPGDTAALEKALQKGDALPFLISAKCKF